MRPFRSAAGPHSGLRLDQAAQNRPQGDDKARSASPMLLAVLTVFLLIALGIAGVACSGAAGSGNAKTGKISPTTSERTSDSPSSAGVTRPASSPAVLFPVKVNGKWGYIDRTGKMVIAPQFDLADPFSEGLGDVELGGKWGYVDGEGNVAIPLEFDFASPFSEGLGLIETGGKSGFVDPQGKMVIAPQFAVAGSFSGGLAAVQRNIGDKMGYIDTKGTMVIPAQFEPSDDFAYHLAGTFSESRVGVMVKGKWGFLD